MNTTNVLLGIIAGLLVLSITYWVGRDQGMATASASFSTSISAASMSAMSNPALLSQALSAAQMSASQMSPAQPNAAQGSMAAPQK